MIAIGLLFSVLCAATKAIDTLINKDVMQNQSATDHALYRIIFVTPLLFLASLFNWRFDVSVLPYLLLYGVLEAVNILFHQLAIKKSNPLHIEVISKSKVIFVLIFSFLLSIDTLSVWSSIGISVFMIGTVLTINFQNRQDEEKTSVAGICFEIISVLARTFKPFILKSSIQKNLISNETLAFLSMIVAFAVLYIAFRPKLSFKQISVKKYLGQAGVVGLGMLLSGWAIIYANTVIVNAIESTSVIFVMLISFIFAKKKYTTLSVIGCAVSIAGIIMAIVL